MKPRRRDAGLGREAVKVNSARLETLEHLLDHALQVVKFDGAPGVESALLRQASRGAKGQRRRAKGDDFTGTEDERRTEVRRLEELLTRVRK